MRRVGAALALLGDVTPAWLRHAAVVFAAAFAGVVLQAVVGAHGVTGIDWGPLLVEALDAAAYTTAAGMLLLVGTPATRQYGVGAGRHQA